MHGTLILWWSGGSGLDLEAEREKKVKLTSYMKWTLYEPPPPPPATP
jgi:hypothetical protein